MDQQDWHDIQKTTLRRQKSFENKNVPMHFPANLKKPFGHFLFTFCFDIHWYPPNIFSHIVPLTHSAIPFKHSSISEQIA